MKPEKSDETGSDKFFRGSYFLKTDSNCRFKIPANFVRILADRYDGTFVMSNHVEHYLNVFPLYVWERIIQNLQKKPDRETRCMMRFLAGTSHMFKLNKTGRIKIPLLLCDYARISPNSKIVAVGMNDYFEIAAEQTFNKMMEESEEILKDEFLESKFKNLDL